MCSVSGRAKGGGCQVLKSEMALRTSLGASRSRLVRQLLTESLILAMTGGALGAVVGFVSLNAIIAIVPPGTIPDESLIAVNTPILLFTFGVSVLTALLFGIAPALHAWTPNLVSALKGTGRASTSSRGQKWVRNGLVVAEVALSLILLLSASLMIRTLLALQDVDLGIRTDRLLTMRIPLNEQLYTDVARRNTFFQQVLERVAGVPGVMAAGLNTSVPALGNWQTRVEVAGSTQRDSSPVIVHQVNENYTNAVGLPTLRGRLFTSDEVAGQNAVRSSLICAGVSTSSSCWTAGMFLAGASSRAY